MDPARDDSGLRSALSTLKPLLTKLGLEPPSRLGPYIPTSDCPSAGDAGRLTACKHLHIVCQSFTHSHFRFDGVVDVNDNDLRPKQQRY